MYNHFMQNLLLPAKLHTLLAIVVHIDQLGTILLEAYLKVQSIRID